MPMWKTQYWFPMMLTMFVKPPLILPKTQTNDTISTSTRENTSIIPKITIDNSPGMREAVKMHNLPEQINDIVLDSWRTKTREKYNSVIKRWQTFSKGKKENGFNTQVSTVLEFLNMLYNRGCRYSALCSASSALASSVILHEGISVSEHNVVKRLINRHPPQPKCCNWDVNINYNTISL